MKCQKWSELHIKDKLAYILCVVAFVSGLLIVAYGVCMPPIGVIDGSVLTEHGMLLSFVGMVLGLNQHYRYKFEELRSELLNKSDHAEAEEG